MQREQSNGCAKECRQEIHNGPGQNAYGLKVRCLPASLASQLHVALTFKLSGKAVSCTLHCWSDVPSAYLKLSLVLLWSLEYSVFLFRDCHSDAGLVKVVGVILVTSSGAGRTAIVRKKSKRRFSWERPGAACAPALPRATHNERLLPMASGVSRPTGKPVLALVLFAMFGVSSKTPYSPWMVPFGIFACGRLASGILAKLRATGAACTAPHKCAVVVSSGWCTHFAAA